MSDAEASPTPDWQQTVDGLDSPEALQCLGTLIRDVHVRAGETYVHDPGEALLFCEAVLHAVQHLASDGRMDRRLAQDGLSQQRGGAPPEPDPLDLKDLAQMMIDRAFGDYVAEPPPEAQRRRVAFALRLDPTCADAYLIQGKLAEDAEQLEAAKAAYTQAMTLARVHLGEWAFTKEANTPFWSDTETRGYMRARQALGMILWKQGRLQEAVEHFQALLKLDPNDHQGNRALLIDCLRELGDEQRLNQALKRYQW